MGITTCGHNNLWALQLVGITSCGHYNLWALQLVDITTCGHYILWALQLVGITTCGHYNLWALQLVGIATYMHLGYSNYGHETCNTTVDQNLVRVTMPKFLSQYLKHLFSILLESF